MGNLHSTLKDLDEALVRADAAIPEVYGLLEYGGETKDKGADFLAQLNEALPAAKAELQRLSTVMSALSDDNLNMLIELLETDSDAAADYFFRPGRVERRTAVSFGQLCSAMAPFYTVLALWVGCLLLSALLTTEAAPIQPGRKNTMMEEYFGKMLTF